jgi:hypothetical protein
MPVFMCIFLLYVHCRLSEYSVHAAYGVSSYRKPTGRHLATALTAATSSLRVPDILFHGPQTLQLTSCSIQNDIAVVYHVVYGSVHDLAAQQQRRD